MKYAGEINRERRGRSFRSTLARSIQDTSAISRSASSQSLAGRCGEQVCHWRNDWGPETNE